MHDKRLITTRQDSAGTSYCNELSSRQNMETVDGNDPELGRLLCLAPITPMNFPRAQKGIFENGLTEAEVWVDPESFSVAAVRTTVGFIFPESIKKAWHQPQ